VDARSEIETRNFVLWWYKWSSDLCLTLIPRRNATERDYDIRILNRPPSHSVSVSLEPLLEYSPPSSSASLKYKGHPAEANARSGVTADWCFSRRACIAHLLHNPQSRSLDRESASFCLPNHDNTTWRMSGNGRQAFLNLYPAYFHSNTSLGLENASICRKPGRGD
jgi:hypothetical protein